MSSFKNKIVLITGGASGIGYLMGEKSLQREARKLIIWDINEDKLLDAAKRLSKQGYTVETGVVDVSDPEQVQQEAKKVLDEHGSIDMLFNNAGIVVGKKFEEHSIEHIKKTMNINSLGLMYVARAFLPAMIENGYGYIINIASAAGLTPNPGMTVYAASKWAAVGWSESLNLELKKNEDPVNVLTVMPSYINTGMFAGVTAPLLMPLLDPDDISTKILDAVEREKERLREPFMVKLTPFIRGILPAKLYDFVAGKIFGVYDSMNTFIGRKTDH
ncbi:MAG: SDR family oxidoreductase [Gracilimonas sp.]|uniref:SDR family oxidoreductase n=1 Tax=Gracilimonas TaxID=649462 RepID=UPI001B2DE02C|nr:SDR family oxidoreductase [Gracilimonas sp.]MBO6585011.1 SDR family oxidoreductase [Gracilimonas sp.]MBO6615718.1 SDR family oxidoreductase [Gracilimonas sp.]